VPTRDAGIRRDGCPGDTGQISPRVISSPVRSYSFVVCRRHGQLPVVVIQPASLGWTLVEGSRAGLYDIALFALGNIFLLGVLVLWTARLIDRLDVQRRMRETMFRRALYQRP
jgi:hypothetical protein